MPVKMGTTDKELHNFVMGKAGRPSYFVNIKNFLQEKAAEKHPIPQRCSVEMMKKITIVLQEELAKKQFQDVGVIVSAIQYVARFPDYPEGIPLLLSNGLVNLLAYVLEETFVSHSDGSKEDTSADSLMEGVLETINDVADYSEDANSQCVGVFTEKLMRLIVSVRKRFQVRMEAVRTLNLLLEGCSNEVIQLVRDYPPSIKLMGSMADLLTSAGDFEMQVACTESLARLVKRSDRSNQDLIQELFSDAELAAAFLEIKDETFETDCRKFLNYVNGCLGSKRSVYSMPCINAYLGSYKLRCPQDENLKEFWVDFNTVSHRISLYVADEPEKENDEGGMWETVTIRKEAVQKFHISERGERQALFISLNVPVSELLAICPSDDNHAHIIFDAKQDVFSAAVAVFGQEKIRNSKHKTSVSQINIQVHLDDSNGSPGPLRNIRSADDSSDTISLQSAKIYGFGSGLNEEPSEAHEAAVASKVQTRRKVSVPVIPMWTPTTRQSGKDASSVCGSARSASTIESHPDTAQSLPSVKAQLNKSEFTQPRTPVKSSSTKRVKTPLQITVSDKATDSGNESTSSHPSIRKKASISSGVSISSCGTPSRLRQKLREAETAGPQDGQTDGGHRSDPGSSFSIKCQQERALTQHDTSRFQNGVQRNQTKGYKSDPCFDSSKESVALPKRQLRARAPKIAPPRASGAKLLRQEPKRNGVGNARSDQGSSGEEKQSKTKGPSRKFRLYSDDGDMLLGSGEADREAIDTDLVIPSSIPTQESLDAIPDSVSPSGQPLPNKSAQSPPLRTQNIFTVHPCYPVAHSPSLSTLTEESAPSVQSKSNKTSTASGGEFQGVKPNSRPNKILPTSLQERIIEEILTEKRVLRPRGGSKLLNVVNEGRQENKSRSEDDSDGLDEIEVRKTRKDKHDGSEGSKFCDRSGSSDDSNEGSQTTDRSESKETSRSLEKGNRTGRRRHPAAKMTKNNSKGETENARVKRKKPRPLPKVSSEAPESSQELSQLEFTSQRESRPKIGRPRKDIQKENKAKRQPKRRGGKLPAEQPRVTAPRHRHQRAAAKAAERDILTQSQLMAATSDASHNRTSNYEPTDTTTDSDDDDNTTAVTREGHAPENKSAAARNKSLESSQDSQELSMYDFVDSDTDKSQSTDDSGRNPCHSGESKEPPTSQMKRRLLMPTQNTQDFSVYEFVDTESSKGSIKHQKRHKKPPAKPLAKAVKKGKVQRKPPTSNSRARNKRPLSPEELSDAKRSRLASVPKTSKKHQESPIELSDTEEPPETKADHPQKRKSVRPSISGDELSDSGQPSKVVRKGAAQWKSHSKESRSRKRQPQSPEELSDPAVTDTDEQENNTVNRHQRKRSRSASPSREELSDIEQPRNAAPPPRNSRPAELEVEQYCDEDVYNFVQSFTKKQRQFLEREFPGDGTTEALSVLSSESRRGTKRSRSKASEMLASSTPTSESTNRELHGKLSKTPIGVSVPAIRQQENRDPPSRDVRSSSRPSSRRPRSFGMEIIEVESEEVATRQDEGSVSSEGGSDADNVSVKNFSKMCQSMIKRSGRGLAATRTRRNIPKINYQYQDSDEQEDEESEQDMAQSSSSPDELCLSVKERHDMDAVSEKSWLAEKPKQRVTTYSKTHSKEWVFHASIINLDTTVKKKHSQRQKAVKRKQAPPMVPSKKSKPSSRTAHDLDDNDPDSLGLCMYYYGEESNSISSSQPHQQDQDKSHLSDKTTRNTSTPWAAISQTQLSSPEDREQDSSTEVARDYHDDEDFYPLTPLHIDEDIKAQILADLVTPKALKVPSSISSKCTGSSGKTPKQVTFGLDPNYDEDLSPVPQNEDLLKSASTLKRKYGSLFSDEESEENDQDVVVVSDADGHRMGLDDHSGQGALKPKKLFKGALSSPTLEEAYGSDNGDVDNEDINATDSLSSTPSTSHASASLPSLQMTKILKAVGENLKRKMINKRTETQQLTEGAVKATHKQVSKLWSRQHHSRGKAHEEFKTNLMSQILNLEKDLDNLQNNYCKMKILMEQRHRNVACTLMHHVQQVKSLHLQQVKEARELNDQLGRHLLHNIKQILTQEMANMREKLTQEAQQHELQQMKKGLRTMFTF